jgi:hypothetical protein
MATVRDTTPAAAIVELAQADPKVHELDSATAAILARATDFSITSVDQYDTSGEVLKSIKAKQRELNDLRLSLTRPLDDAKGRIMALFKPAGDRLSKAETLIKGAMLTFQRGQEERRRIAEAEARAEAERERLKLQRQADAARKKGNEDKAEDLEDRAASVPVPIVTVEKPSVSGVATRTTWRAEVVDMLELVKACAEGRQPLSLLEPNMVILNAQARALKRELTIPGVRAVAEEGIAARAEG